MRKTVNIILTAVLCLSLLSGCADSSAGGGSEAPTFTPQPSATPEPPSTVPDPTAVPEKNGMYDLLSDVFDRYHFGTAGSSLTGAFYAASLVDWGMKNGTGAAVNGARAWDRGTENEYGESLEEKLSSLYVTAMSFYGPGLAILGDCGWQGEWEYSSDDIRSVFQPLFPALGMETPFVVRVYYPDDGVTCLRAEGRVIDPAPGADIARELSAALDGRVLTDGAAILCASLEGTELSIDINTAFADRIRSFGTSGELLTVAAVVNTALDAVEEAQSVRITENGAPLETGHNIYSEPMTYYEP